MRPRAVPLAIALLATAGCGYIQAGAIWYLADESGDERKSSSGGGGSNALPGVTVTTPAGNQSMNVALTYLLVDAEGNSADIAIAYSFSSDGGATWSAFGPATEAAGAPSEGGAGLAASLAGVTHTWVWDSFADLGAVDGLARIRISPTDPGPPARVGIAGETSAIGFTLLNRVIVTVAGGGVGLLAFPGAVSRDGNGNLYVADTFNHRVRLLNTQATGIAVAGVTIAAGQIGVICGTGVAGFNGDNQAATAAHLSFPSGLALDASGNIYVADALNHRIRRVDRVTGFVTTVAGTGTAGSGGDGSLATSAQLDTPRGVAFDGAGNLLVADTGNHVVRVVNNQTAAITVPPAGGVAVAINAMRRFLGTTGTPGATGDGGGATGARLDAPWSLAFDGNGHLYVADSGNHAIRLVNMAASGTITVSGVNIAAGDVDAVVGQTGTGGFAGNGSLARNANLKTPRGVALDGSGNVYVADTGNDQLRVANMQGSSITLAGVTIASDRIDTIGGGGLAPGANDGDGAAATAARLLRPEGVLVLANGHAAIADTGLGRVRVVNVGTGSLAVAGVTIAGGDIATVAGTASLVPLLVDPWGVVRSGTVAFVADSAGNRVYQANLSTGALTAFAGTGQKGLSGNGGPAASARLEEPRGLALDASGNLYIADWANSRVRVVNRQATTQSFHGVSIAPGNIDVVVGPAGLTDSPSVALDASGNLYIAHRGGNRIQRVDTSGTVTTVTGGTQGFADGTLAASQYNGLAHVAVDGSGNLLIADTGNHAIRYANLGATSVTVCGVAVPAGNVRTVAGNPPATGPSQGFNGDNQLGTSTLLDSPASAVRTAAGHVLVVDAGNQRIRRVDQGTGLVTTVCGTGTSGFNADLIPPVNAHLNGPTHASLDGSSPPNLFFSDTGNRRVRRFTP